MKKSIFIMVLILMPIFSYAQSSVPTGFRLTEKTQSKDSVSVTVLGSVLKTDVVGTIEKYENIKSESIAIFKLKSPGTDQGARDFLSALDQIGAKAQAPKSFQELYRECVSAFEQASQIPIDKLTPSQAQRIRSGWAQTCSQSADLGSTTYSQNDLQLTLLNDKAQVIKGILDTEIATENIFKRDPDINAKITKGVKNYNYTSKEGSKKKYNRIFFGPNGYVIVSANSYQAELKLSKQVRASFVNSPATKVYSEGLNKVLIQSNAIRASQGYHIDNHKSIARQYIEQNNLNALTDQISALKEEISTFKINNKPKTGLGFGYCTDFDVMYYCHDTNGRSFSVRETETGYYWSY